MRQKSGFTAFEKGQGYAPFRRRQSQPLRGGPGAVTECFVRAAEDGSAIFAPEAHAPAESAAMRRFFYYIRRFLFWQAASFTDFGDSAGKLLVLWRPFGG